MEVECISLKTKVDGITLTAQIWKLLTTGLIAHSCKWYRENRSYHGSTPGRLQHVRPWILTSKPTGTASPWICFKNETLFHHISWRSRLLLFLSLHIYLYVNRPWLDFLDSLVMWSLCAVWLRRGCISPQSWGAYFITCPIFIDCMMNLWLCVRCWLQIKTNWHIRTEWCLCLCLSLSKDN